ncbi:MAG: hypothetical protein WBD40_17170 [Tepidisphaeraceae bacterium]
MTGFERQLLMVGAPGTGKTSFLALLWLAIVGDYTPGLRLASFQDDRTYLSLIASHLEHCDPALHTEFSEDRALALSLLFGSDLEQVVLRIPDLSGETWLDATVDRQWPVDVDEQIRRCEGVLLFMHANNFDAGATIGEVDELAAIFSHDDAHDGPTVDGPRADAQSAVEAEGAPSSSAVRPPHTPPTQVALVDALQLICEQRGRHPIRVSFVVSAWDLAANGVTPSQFVARNLPLLAQYIETNREWLRVRLFALSAQGGDFVDETRREELARVDAAERAIVLNGDGSAVGVHQIAMWPLGAGHEI